MHHVLVGEERWSFETIANAIVSFNDKSKQVKSTDYQKNGSIPIVDQSSKFICGYLNDETKVYAGKLPVIVFGDHTRHVKFIDFPFVAGADGTQLLRGDSRFDQTFFYYVVYAAAAEIGNYGYDRHFKHLKEYNFNFPPLPQQKKIAEILSTCDEVIEKTEALIQKYEAMKEGLMHDLFTRGIDPQTKQLRPKPENAPELYKQSPLGLIPKIWEVECLGDVTTKIESGWSPNCDAVPAQLEEWGVLKTTAVIFDGYVDSENKRLPSQFYNKLDLLKKIEAKEGDIFITRKGPFDRVGVCAYAHSTREKVIFPDTVFRLTVSKELNKAFLLRALNYETVQKQWDSQKIGLAEAQVNINHGILNRTLYPTPDPIEQELILAKIDKFLNLISKEHRTLEKQKSIKNGLLQDLLRPQDLEG